MKRIFAYRVAFVFLVLFVTACTDPERAFVETVNGFDAFFMRYTALSNYPRQVRANREMAEFVEKQRKPLLDGLSVVANLRAKNAAHYWELHEQNKASIVSSFRRLEAIDKRERMLFSVFFLVFSPDEDAFDMARFPLARDMFSTYLEVLLEESREMLRG